MILMHFSIYILFYMVAISINIGRLVICDRQDAMLLESYLELSNVCYMLSHPSVQQQSHYENIDFS